MLNFDLVNNVRHLYTEWEEFPTELIIRSKTKVTFLPNPITSSLTDAPPYKEDRSSDNAISSKTEECETMRGSEGVEGTQNFYHYKGEEKEVADCVAITSLTSKRSFQDIVEAPALLACTPCPRGASSLLLSSSSSSASSLPSLPHDHFSRSKKPQDEREDKEGKREQREKFSPEELKAIQARVKSSLENQGVFLYDPVTGAGEQH